MRCKITGFIADFEIFRPLFSSQSDDLYFFNQQHRPLLPPNRLSESNKSNLSPLTSHFLPLKLYNRLLNIISRSVFGLDIDFSDIFTDDTDSYKDAAADKPHGENQGRPAGNGLIGK